MNKLLLLVGLVVVAPSVAVAQTANTGFMVQQLFVCPPTAMDGINAFDDLAAPLMEELREEGMIRAWYHIRHAWGDEWNAGWVTIADDHRGWLDFWDAFAARLAERHPDAIERHLSGCTMHKDSMYGVRDSGVGG